jgi:hypothetical protein
MNSSNDNSILDTARGYLRSWGRAETILPAHMFTIADFEVVSKYISETVQVLDAIYYSVLMLAPGVTHDRDTTLELFDAADVIIGTITDFWFTRVDDLDNEEHLLRGDLPVQWLPLRQACMCVYTTAIVVSSILSTNAYPDRLTAFSAVDVFHFPHVVAQGLVHTLKPIATYSTADILWVLDAIAHAWYDIEVDTQLADYVHLIALRVGMLMRCGATVTAFEGAPTDDINLTYVKLSNLHSTPAAAQPTGPAASALCAPTQLLRGILSARLGALISTNWCASRYKMINNAALGTLVENTRATRKREQAMACAPISGHKRRYAEVPPTPSSFAQFDHRWGGVQVAQVLHRYATESATAETTRDQYARWLVDSMLAPGDVSVFKAINRHCVASAAPTNVLKLLRGERMTSEVLRRAKTLGPEPVLRSAVAALTAATSTTTTTVTRSITTIEEEIAGICVLDTLMRNRYGISWIDEYLVLPSNYQSFVETGAIAAESPAAGDAQSSAQEGNTHTHMPHIILTRNTFDVLYEGFAFRSHSLYESMALWLLIIAVVHNGLVPAPTKSAYTTATESADALATCDISELCRVVQLGHQNYVVRARGDTKTQYGTVSYANATITTITSI